MLGVKLLYSNSEKEPDTSDLVVLNMVEDRGQESPKREAGWYVFFGTRYLRPARSVQYLCERRALQRCDVFLSLLSLSNWYFMSL